MKKMSKKMVREPPAKMKAEEELTDLDRKELEDLQIGDATVPCNAILSRVVSFTLSDGWVLKKIDKSHGIRWEEKRSTHNNNMAVKYTVNIPNCTTGTLEEILLSDTELTDDPEVSMMYVYDRLLERNEVVKRVAGNVLISRLLFRSPVRLISPREMLIYSCVGSSLAPEQQTKLGLWPSSLPRPAGAETKKRDDHLMAFIQCGVEYDGKEEIDVAKGYVRGHLHHYMVMGQEEVDGSMTLTLLFDMNPSGSIPASIVESANTEQLKKAQLLVDLIKSIGFKPHTAKVYQNTRDFLWFN